MNLSAMNCFKIQILKMLDVRPAFLQEDCWMIWVLSAPGADSMRPVKADIKYVAADYDFIPTYGIHMAAGRNFSRDLWNRYFQFYY